MKKYLPLALRLIAAIILLQTLYFKFSAHPDSVALFTQLGLEPHGRIGIGIMELIAAILIMMPKTIWMGAGLTVGLMAGAIFSHLTELGIVFNDDGGTLFALAVITLVCAAVTLWLDRKRIPFLNL